MRRRILATCLSLFALVGGAAFAHSLASTDVAQNTDADTTDVAPAATQSETPRAAARMKLLQRPADTVCPPSG